MYTVTTLVIDLRKGPSKRAQTNSLLTLIVKSYCPATAQVNSEYCVFGLLYVPPDRITPDDPHLSVTVHVVSPG